MLLALIGQEFGRRQRKTRCDNSFDGRVVGQVQEQTYVLHGAVLFEVLLEETRRFHVDTHSGKHDGKVVLVVVEDRFARYADETGLL